MDTDFAMRDGEDNVKALFRQGQVGIFLVRTISSPPHPPPPVGGTCEWGFPLSLCLFFYFILKCVIFPLFILWSSVTTSLEHMNY